MMAEREPHGEPASVANSHAEHSAGSSSRQGEAVAEPGPDAQAFRALLVVPVMDEVALRLIGSLEKLDFGDSGCTVER